MVLKTRGGKKIINGKACDEMDKKIDMKEYCGGKKWEKTFNVFYWTFKKEELYMLKVAIYSEKYRIVFVRKV